jgi:hypothetical protein
VESTQHNNSICIIQSTSTYDVLSDISKEKRQPSKGSLVMFHFERVAMDEEVDV